MVVVLVEWSVVMVVDGKMKATRCTKSGVYMSLQRKEQWLV